MFFTKVKVDHRNSSWGQLHNSQRLGVSKIPIPENASFFTMGSCFAEHVRRALSQRGYDCFPKLSHIEVNNCQKFDGLKYGREHTNQYSSVSIKQEIRRSLNLIDGFEFEQLSGYSIADSEFIASPNDTCFQDPYRRMVFANTHSSLSVLTESITNSIGDGLKEASVWIITLGVSEVFKSLKTGYYITQYPGYMRSNRQTYEFSNRSYLETLSDLEDIVQVAQSLGKHVIFSVSPVPLGRTFSKDDIFVASMRGKSVLRAAVASVCNGTNVHYFPAYELAYNRGSDFFDKSDGRHPKSSEVDFVMEIFSKAILP